MDKINSALRKTLKIFYYIIMGNIIIYQKHMLPNLNSFEDYLTFNTYMYPFLIVYGFILYFGAIFVFWVSFFISSKFLRFILNKDDSYLEFKGEGDFITDIELAITHLIIFVYFTFDTFIYFIQSQGFE